jgi:alpha-mannosidase
MAVANHFRRTLDSFLGKIKQRLYQATTPIATWNYREAIYEGPGQTRYTSDWSTIEVGQAWYASTAYFQTQVTLDAKHAGHPVFLRFNNEGECLFYLNGAPQQGFDPNRSLCRLSESGVAGEVYDLTIEASIRWQNLAHAVQGGLDYGTHLFRTAEIVTLDEMLYHLLLDLEVLYEYYLLTESAWALELLNEARRHMKPDDEDGYFQEGARRFGSWLSERWPAATDNAADREIVAVGHSHLDLAYLWPAKESVRKCGRTFSNMLQLLDRYPEFHFSQSQATQYRWAKEHYPALYEKIKYYVAEGRWELIGGMLVEPDCNLISGESLIRQTAFGQKFYQEEFGRTTEICWLPDTFGYPAYLPQVLSKCGFRYFYTCKINNNLVNVFPHHLFQWEAPDGSKLIAILDMFNSYSAEMKLPAIDSGIKNFRNTKYTKDMMTVYGYGDGGGGVTAEMIERSRRYTKLPGMPKIKPGTAASYFAKLNMNREQLPTWRGELYFEWHQGTYTSQAAAKRNNRKAELLYRNAELLLALQRAPGCQLKEGWERLLFQQFHDILPGTSQADTYVTAEQEYARIFEIGETAQAGALSALVGPAADHADDVVQAAEQEKGRSFVLFNSLAFARTEWVECDLQVRVDEIIVDGASSEQVVYSRLPNGRTLLYAERVPSVGYKRYLVLPGTPAPPASSDAVSVREDGDSFTLENGELRIVVSKQSGFLDKVWDKRFERSVLKASGKPGNALEIFEELYDFYDAWNIDEETLAAGGRLIDQAESVELVSSSATIAVLRVKKTINRSCIVQDIVLKAYERKVDFRTEADWNETGRLLKAGFDLDIHADRATYDMSFGHIERPTHNNTSWDRAQWEVSAHHWVDLSERNYGAALLNEGKFGYDIKGGLMRITLLKAPKYPDTTCDIGHHSFSYSLYLHDGEWRAGHVDEEGWKYNAPLLYHPVAATAWTHAEESWLTIGACGVFLSAAKPADDGSGDLIVRVYENHGARIRDVLQLNNTFIDSAAECDMLEHTLRPIEHADSSIPFELTPFEIKTFRIKRK